MVYKVILQKSTCPTGSFTCPGPSGRGVYQTLVVPCHTSSLKCHWHDTKQACSIRFTGVSYTCWAIHVYYEMEIQTDICSIQFRTSQLKLTLPSMYIDVGIVRFQFQSFLKALVGLLKLLLITEGLQKEIVTGIIVLLQYFCRRFQAGLVITWTNVDRDLCCHMATLCHNELTSLTPGKKNLLIAVCMWNILNIISKKLLFYLSR